mmetsp:Transcript_2738/g.3889  ORF Transcript_2738/g.3889 Transcript_2738/m.3889 type:complete len:152 (+) Transcript_2738:179-634(+)
MTSYNITKVYYALLLACTTWLAIQGFTGQAQVYLHRSNRVPHTCMTKNDNDDNLTQKSKGGPFGGIVDMFSNFDDVIDDFFYKRMGKGEIFYGKRKYKPSGTVEGSYNGMGLSDKLKIDMTRQYREDMLEERKMRKEIEQLKVDFEKRKKN